MRRYLLVILLFFTTLLVGQELYLTDSVNQGETFMAVIFPVSDSSSVRCTLYSEDNKTVLNLSSFDYYLYERAKSVKISIGGIPTDLKPGRYKFVANGSSYRDYFFLERYIEVQKKEYPSTILFANPQMENIKNGPISDERVEQSKRLWDAFERYTPYGIYEVDNFTLPVEGRYTSPFGFSRITRFPGGSSSTSVHKGEDIAAERGTKILSPGRGRVVLAENRIVSGNSVLIEHLPGVISVYYHMDKFVVTKGQMIERGDLIGYVGSTGYSTGPHLHWELRISTVPVNPLQFIDYPLIDKSFIMTIIDSTNNKKGG